jgi:outer membrane protein
MLVTLSLALLAGASPPPALTLDDALTEAARANADVELARTQSLAAGTDVYGSYAGVLPRLDLSAAFGHDFVGARNTVAAFPTSIDPSTGQPIFQQSVVAIPPSDNADYSLGLTLQLPIFDGGRSWGTIRRARVAARGAERSYDEATLSVAFEVTRRFYEVVKATESLRVLVETVARSAEIVRRAEALFEAGRGSRADVLTARGNLGNDRVAVEQQRARLAQAQADLGQVLGRDTAEPVEVVPPAAVTGAAVPAAEEPPDEGALLEAARRTRPLLAAQADAVRASEIGEDLARGAFYPVVAAQGTYNRSGPALAGREGVYGDPSRQYAANAGVVLQWNLFNGRQTLADAQRAAIATRRARAQAAQAGQQVAAEIARARANIVALARAAGIAAENLAVAEQGVALARERLGAGAASQLEVRDASLKLTQAQLQLVEARVDHAVARADLRRAVGGAL